MELLLKEEIQTPAYEFVFILHLMKEIMKIINVLCEVLRSKSQDILNVMQVVSSSKALI